MSRTAREEEFGVLPVWRNFADKNVRMIELKTYASDGLHREMERKIGDGDRSNRRTLGLVEAEAGIRAPLCDFYEAMRVE